MVEEAGSCALLTTVSVIACCVRCAVGGAGGDKRAVRQAWCPDAVLGDVVAAVARMPGDIFRMIASLMVNHGNQDVPVLRIIARGGLIVDTVENGMRPDTANIG